MAQVISVFIKLSFFMSILVISQLCVADDVDLYRTKIAEKPRVLLILDTSTSMNIVEDRSFCKGLLRLDCSEGTRFAFAKRAIKKIIQENPDVEFALMKSNGPVERLLGFVGGFLSNLLKGDISNLLNSSNGYIVHGFGTDNSEIIATVDSWNMSLFTFLNFSPAVEMLHESWLYLRGERVGHDDLELLEVVDLGLHHQGQYISPFSSEQLAEKCESNINIVLITDADSLLEQLPILNNGREDDIERLFNTHFSQQPISTEGSYLPAMAKLLHQTEDFRGDFFPQTSMVDKVTVHTVGFSSGLFGDSAALLSETAKQGGGSFYSVHSQLELEQALTSSIYAVKRQTSNFTSPVVTLDNNDKTRHKDAIYLTMFQPQEGTRWVGNLKKFKIKDGDVVDAQGNSALDSQGNIKSTSRSYWLPPSAANDGADIHKGGVNQHLSAQSSRTILTDSHNKLVPLTTAEMTEYMFNINDSEVFNEQTEDEVTTLVKWVYGLDVEDENNNNDRNEMRANIFGDPLHSKPVSLDYGGGDVRVLVGTNAGFLHMFQDKNDELTETWAFIPQSLYGILKPLKMNSANEKVYGVDGPMSLFIDDTNNNGEIETGERVWLFFGLRRGGRSYYAIDISNPDKPELLWQLDGGESADFSELGQTWSKPIVSYIKINGYEHKPVLIFAAGYDVKKDGMTKALDTHGRDIYIVDAQSGSKIWSLRENLGFRGAHSIAADVSVYDSDYDGYIDRLYAADTGGDVWRVNMPTDEDWSYYKLASLGAGSINNKRFFYPPVIARTLFNKVTTTLYNGQTILTRKTVPFDAILLGSGNRADPLAQNSVDELYMLRDMNTASTSSSEHTPMVITNSDLLDVSDDPFAKVKNDIDAFSQQELELGNKHGWRYRFANQGEKSLAAPTVIGGIAYFTSFTPQFSSTAQQCENKGGQGRMYAFHLHYGTQVYDQLNYLTNDEVPSTPQLYFGSKNICSDDGSGCDEFGNESLQKSQFLIVGPWLKEGSSSATKAANPFVPSEVLGPSPDVDEDGIVKLIDTNEAGFGFRLQQTYIYKQDIISK